MKKAVPVSEHQGDEKLSKEVVAQGKVSAKGKYDMQEKYFKAAHDAKSRRDLICLERDSAQPHHPDFEEEEEKNKSPGARAQLYTPQKPAGGEADIDPSEQENFINSLRDCLEPKRGAGHKKVGGD